MAKVTQIVLTGAPGGGKSTIISKLSELIPEWGYRVLVVQEAARKWLDAGMTHPSSIMESDPRRFLELETAWLQNQIHERECAMRQVSAFPEHPWVILYDRAETDTLGFIGPEMAAIALSENGWDAVALRDSYDAVIHLQSAAHARGYNQDGVRIEDPSTAIGLDRTIAQAWTGHPHVRIIKASDDFEEKVGAAVKAVARVLGVPTPLEIERKFLLAAPPDFSHPGLTGAVRIGIEQAYLNSGVHSQLRIRKRSQDGTSSYFLTEKSGHGLKRTEEEGRLSQHEYRQLLKQRDPSRAVVRKNRWCFIYDNQYLELDEVLEPATRKCWLLEVELTEEADKVALPPFLRIEREVTEDPYYYMAEVAKG